MNLSQVLASAAARHAHKDAIVFEGKPYMFQDFVEHVNRSGVIAQTSGCAKR